MDERRAQPRAPRGRLVVLEGLDGSGKATQAKLLAARLAAAGKEVRAVSFPDYGSESSALVKLYLSGAFGAEAGAVNAFAASAFYAVDRYAAYKRDWGAFYEAGGLVLADRYATSNAVHQCAKLPRGDWPAFVRWLQDFEYLRLGIPKPDAVFYLDTEPAVSQELLARRYTGADGRDIHERDTDYLRRCRGAAHWCAEYMGWRVVNCSPAGAMRPAESITEELLALILEAL